MSIQGGFRILNWLRCGWGSRHIRGHINFDRRIKTFRWGTNLNLHLISLLLGLCFVFVLLIVLLNLRMMKMCYRWLSVDEASSGKGLRLFLILLVDLIGEVQHAIRLSIGSTYLITYQSYGSVMFIDQILQRNLNFTDRFIWKHKWSFGSEFEVKKEVIGI